MRKIKSAKKVSLKEILLTLALVLAAGTATPVVTQVEAATVETADNAQTGDDLFVDDTDDAKTEDIKETDVIKDNVVEEENHVNETGETATESTEKTNDGGSCVTPENNYTEGEGEYWDSSIKTEEEKKGINQDTPNPDEPTPDTPTPDEPTPDTPTPKTGDEENKFLAILAALGLTGAGMIKFISAAKPKKETVKLKKR